MFRSGVNDLAKGTLYSQKYEANISAACRVVRPGSRLWRNRAVAYELRRREGKIPSIEDRMVAMINVFVSHNRRRTVLDGKRDAPVNHKSRLFE
jgi:hypothetical protein